MIGIMLNQLMVYVIKYMFVSIDRRTIDGLGYRVCGRCNRTMNDC